MAVDSGKLDVTDAYTTDGELDTYDLRLLHDDRSFFPGYDAVLLARSDLPEPAAQVLQALSGRIDEATMRALNRRVANEQQAPRQVAADFLRDSGLADPAVAQAPGMARRILGYTAVHLKLTLSALLLACLVAIPAALALARYSGIARSLLYVTGLIQTVPALALLALLIPLVGLGQVPAIIALFLYSLLPIVRNTLTGIFGVDPLLKEVATGMGLTPGQQLWKVELPLAVPTILAGIKTAAIISIGTATLAAFVGAGGLGEPIITGLTLNDHRLILEGAIPAALLAITVELLFEAIERATIPAHLRT
jgi:osmoprotectant transport system permease protein